MKIGLGIPTVGGVAGEALSSHLAVAVELGREGEVMLASTHDFFGHDRVREMIIQACLDSACDLLFFVDSDQILPGGAFKELRKVMETESNAVVTTGFYYKRGYPFTSVWSNKHVYVDVSANGKTEDLTCCGMGCALINLHWVREHLKPPYFRIIQAEFGTTTWEDGYFCGKVILNGGRVVGVPSVRCGHLWDRVVVDDSNQDSLRKGFLKTQLPRWTDEQALSQVALEAGELAVEMKTLLAKPEASK